MPAAIPWHTHVSERELAHQWPDGQQDDGRWEDCLWCSCVEMLNDTWKDVPDTLAFAEKLRDASGEPPTGGSNAWDAARGIKVVTGLVVPPIRGFDSLWNALKPGTAAAIAGSMGAFPSGHRLRRWLPSFAGGHSVYVARVDANARVWWCDPLAPRQVTAGGYNGEWVLKGDLKRFVDKLPGGGHLVRALRSLPAPAPPDTSTGDSMAALKNGVPLSIQVGGNGGIPANAQGVSVNVTAVAPTADGYATITVSPQAAPKTSTVNFLKGQNQNSGGVFALKDGKLACVVRSADSHIVLDATGYFLYGLWFPLPEPVRVFDSRV